MQCIAVVTGKHVVLAAPSVGSAVLQADTAAKQKPESLLQNTEAICSSRLYNNTQTHTESAEQRRRDKIGRERTEGGEIPRRPRPEYKHTLRGRLAQIKLAHTPMLGIPNSRERSKPRTDRNKRSETSRIKSFRCRMV